MGVGLRRLVISLLVGVVVMPPLAGAAVQVTGTRFVYPAGEREIIVQLNNTGARPALVQAWLDSGDASMQPGSEQLPFVVLPPLMRVEAQKGQALRISKVGGGLPQDRESVFWLNVLDMPPKAEDVDGRNIVQLAFRTRLKLFYRPDGLPGTPGAAVEALAWVLAPHGRGYALRVRNDSAYHVSFSRVALQAAGKTYDSVDAGGMVAPHGVKDFPLKGLQGSVSAGEVEVRWVDDFGASRERFYRLSF
ncbi:chaperone protein ecpD [Pseudomonas sp. AOB-7]|uniref:fimbria/pilus periplasmic chaperone n=1 Tax=Pseudomonas sp. AOB-7 TaxID=2482750 RepID=UPI000EFAC731|nr:fimbria/pilus periplasmic chaperone [Pseudomonas sp. AOB-7]RMH82371.1 chaperone protein ecpD [Pseudomonas sp. AOB-7]